MPQADQRQLDVQGDAVGQEVKDRTVANNPRANLKQLRQKFQDPNNVKVVTAQDCYEAWFRYNPAICRDLGVLDAKVRVATKPLFIEFLQASRIDAIGYESDFYDCDDFAICLKAEYVRLLRMNSMALVCDFKRAHAYNAVFLWRNGQVVVEFFEPQTDRFQPEMFPCNNGYAIC